MDERGLVGRDHPGELEQMVLLAVLRLGEGAFALPILEELDREVGRRLSRGSVYKCLDRLEGKGLLSWSREEAGPERGGHPRRCFHLTTAGLETLRHARAAWLRLWDGVEPALEGGSE